MLLLWRFAAAFASRTAAGAAGSQLQVLCTPSYPSHSSHTYILACPTSTVTRATEPAARPRLGSCVNTSLVLSPPYIMAHAR